MEPKTKKRKITTTKSVLYTDQQIKEKQEAGKNKNTTKTDERANRAFRNFLKDNGESNLDYWNYEEPELDSFLSRFWFGARKDPYLGLLVNN